MGIQDGTCVFISSYWFSACQGKSQGLSRGGVFTDDVAHAISSFLGYVVVFLDFLLDVTFYWASSKTKQISQQSAILCFWVKVTIHAFILDYVLMWRVICEAWLSALKVFVVLFWFNWMINVPIMKLLSLACLPLILLLCSLTRSFEPGICARKPHKFVQNNQFNRARRQCQKYTFHWRLMVLKAFQGHLHPKLP